MFTIINIYYIIISIDKKILRKEKLQRVIDMDIFVHILSSREQ